MRRIMPICAILLFMSAGSYMASVITRECSTMQEISCEGLQTSYHVPDNVVMNLTDDCEHGWYYPNRTCIADSTGDEKKSRFAKNLTMSTCLNLEWHVECPNSKEIVRFCKIIFSVSKPSKPNNDSQTGNKTCSEDKPDCNQKEDLNGLPPLTIALIVIVIVFVVGGVSFAFWNCYRQRGKRSNGVL